jgi:hypothetical protein
MLKKNVTSKATLPMRDIQKVWPPRSQKVQYNNMSKKIFHFELSSVENFLPTILILYAPCIL